MSAPDLAGIWESKSMGASRRWSVSFVAVVVLVAAGFVFVAPTVAQAGPSPTCTISWANPVSGDWATASNWSPNGVPGPSDVVCITVAGTYTVTMDSVEAQVASFTLGGGATGTQTLLVSATSSDELYYTSPSTIASNGVLTLGDGGAGSSQVDGDGTGTLTNGGTINAVQGGGGNRLIDSSIDNETGANVNISGSAVSQASNGATTLTNDGGTVTVTSTGSYTLSNESGISNLSGTYANDGATTLDGGTFIERGTVTGNPVTLDASTLDDDTSAGAAPFLAVGAVDLVGTGPNPGVASGQVITIDSVLSGEVSLMPNSASFTNDGSIVVGTTGTAESDLDGTSTSLFNNGTISTVQGTGGARFLNTNITNEVGGQISIGSGDTESQAGHGATTLTNSGGTVTVESSASYTVSNGSGISNLSGTIANNGAVAMSGTGTFVERATVTGNPISLDNTTLDDDTSAGASQFLMQGASLLVGSGSNPGVATGQVITISASPSSYVTLTPSHSTFVNDGTIDVGDSGSGYSEIYGISTTMTNNGVIATVQGGGGERDLDTNITNEVGGQVNIGSDDTVSDTTLTNDGTLSVAAGASYTLSGGSSVVQNTSGTFATTIDTSVPSFGQLVGGPVSLAGTLQVTTLGTPGAASSWPIITGASSVSGTFTNTLFSGATYPVDYAATSVTLGPVQAVAGSISVSSGSSQSATVGQPYTAPLAALVKDTGGNPVPDIAVTFTAPSTGASGAFAESVSVTAVTNGSGIATAPAFTANETTGPFAVVASTGGLAPASFTLTNTPAAATVEVQSGSPQSTPAGIAFSTNLSALVVDEYGNPLPSQTVTFTAPASGASGTFANGTTVTTAVTNSLGVAIASTFTANDTVGGPYNVSASTGSAIPTAFVLSNTAPAATVSVDSGSPQSMTVGDVYASPLSALVTNVDDDPVAGVAVTFTAPSSGASGTFANSTSTETVSTNPSGIATATFTANTLAGAVNVKATSGSATPATFILTNNPGTAATVSVSSGSPASTPSGLAFSYPLVALVTDQYGNAVPNQTVTFTAPATGASGTFANDTVTTTAVTTSAGLATSSTFTANATIGGPYSVTASTGSATPATFSLTNTSAAATIAVSGGSGQSATVATNYTSKLSVLVTNVLHTPVSGTTVTFTAPATGASGTFANGTATTTAVTNGSGIATSTTFTANTVAGAFGVQATSGSATPATFSLTNNPGAATTVKAYSGTPGTAPAGLAFANLLVAQVLDKYGNPVPNQTVRFTAPATGAAGKFANGTPNTTAVTTSQGLATASTFTANATVGGPYTVSATTGSATPATFSLTNTPPAATVAVSSGSPQSATVASAYTSTLVALVTNVLHNPVAGATVTFTAPTSGASGTFANGSTTTTAVTNASGIATSTAFTANTVAGGFNVRATTGSATAATFTLTNIAGAAARIAAYSGSPQSTNAGSAFKNALAAQVLDKYGNPVPSQTVTFTAPSSGASGTFANGSATTNATTNASGVATSTTFTANATAGGPYNVSATTGTLSPVTYSLTNTPPPLTATRTSLQSVQFVDELFLGGPLDLEATVAIAGPNPGGASPTGIVDLDMGSTVLAISTLSTSGIATFDLTDPPRGTIALTAVYMGNASLSPSTSASVTLNIPKIESGATATYHGTTYTVTIGPFVPPAGGGSPPAATGSLVVQLTYLTTKAPYIVTQTLTLTVVNGQTQFTLPPPPAGALVLVPASVIYSGDANYTSYTGPLL